MQSADKTCHSAGSVRPERQERPDRPVPVRSSYTEDDDFIEDWNEPENEGEEFEGEE